MPNYQIALTNTPFDNSYTNVLRFDTRAEQEAYFNVNTLFSNQSMVNFNVKNLFMPILTYDCKINENINELLSKNYCIVKDNTPNAVLKYYYYFITNAIQENSNRITISARMDIMQTYYIDLKFSQCFINKAHLNRFIDNGDGTVSFDGRVESALFEREDIKNVAKRMTKRQKVSFYPDTELGNWLNNNIAGWVYLYVDKDHTYNVRKISDAKVTATANFVAVKNGVFDKRTGSLNENDSTIPSNLAVLTYPIYKASSNRIILYYGIDKRVNWGELRVGASRFETVLDLFSKLNNGYSNVYAIKISSRPPTLKYDIEYFIDSRGDLNLGNCQIVDDTYIDNPLIYRETLPDPEVQRNSVSVGEVTNPNSSIKYAPAEIISNISYDASAIDIQYEHSFQYSFEKTQLINSNKNPAYNPKLLSLDFCSITLSTQTEDGYDYDIQKINKKLLNLSYTEPLVPDMAKIYLRITDLDGVYIKECDENLTGFIGNNDTSLIMPTSAYQSMLANNKNFFLQNSINRGFDVLNSAVNYIPSMNVDNPLSKVQSFLSTGLNYAQSRINEGLTIDNLKNAPNKVVGAKGNPIFEASYSEMGVIVEEWDILPNEKEMINDYMCLYGFTFNRLGNIKDFDNIRKYYNYIRADVQEISSDVGINISETVHDEFKRIFNKGVRFWNTDNFNYDKENYERWLEND